MQLRRTACAAWLAACVAVLPAPAAAQGAGALLGMWKGEAFGFTRQQRPYFILVIEESGGRLQCWMSADNEPPKSRPAQCTLAGSKLQLTTWNSSYVTVSLAGNPSGRTAATFPVVTRVSLRNTLRP